NAHDAVRPRRVRANRGSSDRVAGRDLRSRAVVLAVRQYTSAVTRNVGQIRRGRRGCAPKRQGKSLACLLLCLLIPRRLQASLFTWCALCAPSLTLRVLMKTHALLLGTAIVTSSLSALAQETTPTISETPMKTDARLSGNTNYPPSDLPAPESRSWINKPLLITGSALLVTGYVPALIVSQTSDRP